MKESTGGALLMGLAAGIIIIFIILVAFFISYGKSFKIKNALINKIEQSEGMTTKSIETFLEESGYYGEFEVCSNKLEDNDNNLIGFNFEITIYMAMDRNILGNAFNVKIPIRGETRIIESGTYFEKIKAGQIIGSWPSKCSG